MAFTVMWAHGNALVVESPENLSSNKHFAWGSEFQIPPGVANWFHVPLPTPIFLPGGDGRAKLLRVFVLFESTPGGGRLTNVHLYDGRVKFHQFDNLALQGDHHGITADNTFAPSPQEVFAGIGVSFSFRASTGAPFPSTRLVVTSVGADYEV